MINKVGTEWPIENLDAPRDHELECHNRQASETKADGKIEQRRTSTIFWAPDQYQDWRESKERKQNYPENAK